MIKTKITSSLEKIFADERLENYPTLERLSALRGERVSVQFVYTYERTPDISFDYRYRTAPVVGGTLAPYVTLRDVKQIPVILAANPMGCDDNMLRTTPGLYPDVLEPLHYGGLVTVTPEVLCSVWIELELPRDIAAGEHTLTVSLDCEQYGKSESAITVEVIGATLPDESIYFTQWFHCDGLAQYYEVPVWSEKHWLAIENFTRVAVKNGINMLLTPVFTPPLDTAVGGERLTTQLVGVEVEGGKYTFDFTLLDRWVDMCDRTGVKYLEISHLFTQWGVAHAPKIMATVDGEYKRIFGWETSATSDEYRAFIRQFLTELIAHLKKRGNDKRCFFHISDEPDFEHLEAYKAAQDIIGDIVAGYPVMDALSNFEFYKTGVIKRPICSSNHISPFLEAKVPNLWTYYCVGQWDGVSNRYHSMPAWRNRSIGMQMYKYDIEGFLHWGYNFYNNQFSENALNPYLETACDLGFPAGDAYSVYPGPNATCLESARLKVFYEALQDMRAMRLCETLYSHEEVVAAIEEAFGGEIVFDKCARSAAQMLAVREKVNAMIKAKI